MAVSFVASATGVHGLTTGAGVATAALTVPSTAQAGDLLVLRVAYNNVATLNAPSGWTAIHAPVKSTETQAVFYRVATSGDPGSSLTVSFSAASQYSVSCEVYRGVDTTTPIHAQTSGAEATSGTAHTTPTLTTTIATWVLEACSDKGSPSSTSYTVAGATLRSTNIGTGTASSSLGIADSNSTVAAGTVGGHVFTGTLNTATACMSVVALTPAAGAPATAAGTASITVNATGTATANATPTVRQTIWEPRTSGAEFVSKIANGTSVSLKIATTYGGTPVYAGTGQTPDADGYVRHTATGLTPGVRYYAWYTDTNAGTETAIGAAGAATYGRCNTLPALSSFKVAFGACVTTNNTDGSALADIEGWAPDFWMHLGDLHYANPTSTDYTVHDAAYETQIAGAGSGHYASLFRDWGVFYVPSDHDFGPTDNGPSDPADFPGAPAASKSVQVVFPTGTLADARSPRAGVYRTWVVGRVRFIQVDVRNQDRSNVTSTGTSTDTMLGATQLAWLKTQLTQPEPFKVIVCDTAWMGAADNSGGVPVKGDWWPAYPVERQAVIDYIAANNCGHVELWHGDSHTIGYASPAKNTWGGFSVLCAAPFANTAGGRDLSTFTTYYPTTLGGDARQYGRVTFTDDGTTIIRTFDGYDAQAATVRMTDTVTVTSASGSGSVTGSATGIAQGGAAGTGGVSIAATGTAQSNATGAGAAVTSASGTTQGAAAGAAGVATTATGLSRANATGTAPLTVTAAGNAGTSTQGTASIAVSAAGTAQASASGTTDASTSAAGTAGARATGATIITVSASGTTGSGVSGTAGITVSATSTANAQAAVSGMAAVTITSGGGVGGNAAGSGDVSITASAWSVRANATGSTTLTVSASGSVGSTPSVQGTVVVTVAASGTVGAQTVGAAAITVDAFGMVASGGNPNGQHVYRRDPSGTWALQTVDRFDGTAWVTQHLERHP